jgi:hypothetical protein
MENSMDILEQPPLTPNPMALDDMLFQQDSRVKRRRQEMVLKTTRESLTSVVHCPYEMLALFNITIVPDSRARRLRDDNPVLPLDIKDDGSTAATQFSVVETRAPSPRVVTCTSNDSTSATSGVKGRARGETTDSCGRGYQRQLEGLATRL